MTPIRAIFVNCLKGVAKIYLKAYYKKKDGGSEDEPGMYKVSRNRQMPCLRRFREI